MTPHERVTPEELDAWLRSTVVIEAEIQDDRNEHSLYEADRDRPQKKRKICCRSSLDKDNVFSRSSFGVRAMLVPSIEALKDEGEEDNILDELNPYFKLPSEGSDILTVNSRFRGIPDCHDVMLSTKKRKVSSPPPPDDIWYHSQTSPQPAGRNNNTPHSRLVTDDSFPLDHMTRYSQRSSCQYTQPFHTIYHEARYSRRSSLHTVPSDTHADLGVNSFLHAMALSQRSQNILSDLKFSESCWGSLEAMRESEMSRSLLFKISQRNTGAKMRSILNGVQCGSFLKDWNEYEQESVAAELQRIVREEMLR